MRRNVGRVVSLKLDGVDDSVTTPSYSASTTAFTVAFWYKPQRTIDANDRVMDHRDAGPANGFHFIHATAGSPQLTFTIANDTNSVANITSTNMRLGEWNWVVGEYAVNSVKLYVNNVQQGATDTAATMTAATARIYIGQRTTSAANFAKGWVRDFRIYGRVLTTDERTNLYNGNEVAGADIHYKLDDLSGASAHDSSGNGRHGTINGGALYTTEPGRVFLPSFTKALNFAKKTTAKVSIADAAPLRIETGNTFSWTAWVYLFDTRENVLIRIAEKAPHFWCVMSDQTVVTTPNRAALEICDATSSSDTSEYWGNTPLTTNRWYHLAVTFAEGTTKHYIDGELDVTNLILPEGSDGYTTGMQDTVTDALILGNSSGGSRNWPGLIRDFRQFNVVLTQDEVRAISRGNTVSRGLVGSWAFSEGSGTEVADSVGGRTGTVTAATWATLSTARASATRSPATTRTAA